jgi:hypothetical protein
VVAERDRVGARLQQPVGELRRDPDAVGDVLAVDDDDVGRDLVAERRQPFLDGPPPGDADDVGNEEQPQGRLRVVAPRSSIETWFPASCV